MHRTPAVFGLALLIAAAALIGHARAQQPVVQGFGSDQSLEKGRIVMLDPKDTTKIVAATSDHLDKMYGVVVDPNDAPVTLTKTGQRTFVAAGGRYQVLVSTENGNIAPDDYISLAVSDGIGAKAQPSQKYIFGKALQSFDGSQGSILKTSSGNSVGRITVDVSIGRNPSFKSNDILPDFLRKTSESIAGKPVNPLRIYLGLGILLVTGFITVSILYSGIRNALISIGRNPLSKKSITKGMVQVLLFGLIVLVIGIFGVYLLLKI